MAMKLIIANGEDKPCLVCDVCGKLIQDMWSDKVSGSRGTEDSPGNVVFHHATCPTQEPLQATVADFFWMFMARNRVGDLGSQGLEDAVILSRPRTLNMEARSTAPA
jgi:hypothetical protein